MQGSKYTDREKEQALALLAIKPLKEVAEELQMPERTLRDWRDTQEKINPEFAKLRLEKKEEFVKDAWEIIGKANILLKKKINRAIEEEEKIDDAIDKVCRDTEISKEEKRSLLNKLNALKVDNLGQLSTVIGTLYDKQALINKESTVNHGVSDTLESVLRNITGDEM